MKPAKKIRVAVLFGGQSAEHEVSLRSAKNIIAALDPKKYRPILVGITKDGYWLSPADSALLLAGRTIKKRAGKIEIKVPDADVVFPALHGPLGEDGTVQGLLKLLNIPFVGADVIGSAVGMDKDVMKRLLRDAGLPIGKFLVLQKSEKHMLSFTSAKQKLGLPLFIKPANLGSSVGVSKVRSEKEFAPALELAFKHDNKILIEEFIPGREIECAVLGNEQPVASIPGEIVPTHEFYSYEAKYLDEHGAIVKIPADLPAAVVKQIQKLSVQVFQTLCCRGLGRVDFFLTKENKVYVNEINTLPGFTSISMYPKLWMYGGLSYPELIDRIIQLALSARS